jgi:hypothetical protein
VNLLVFIPVIVTWCLLLGDATPIPVKSPQPNAAPSFAFLASSIVLSILGLALCGIPFMPPVVVLVVPLVGISLLLLVGAFHRRAAISLPRLLAAGFATGINLFALYLALTGHHLIDWLESF